MDRDAKNTSGLSEENKIVPINLNCNFCLHKHEINWTCQAFRSGIPDEILTGDNNHTKPLPNQKNDIVFEPIKA